MFCSCMSPRTVAPVEARSFMARKPPMTPRCSGGVMSLPVFWMLRMSLRKPIAVAPLGWMGRRYVRRAGLSVSDRSHTGSCARMDLALLVLRIVVGGLFVGHGAQKLFGMFGGHGPAGAPRLFGPNGGGPGGPPARAPRPPRRGRG